MNARLSVIILFVLLISCAPLPQSQKIMVQCWDESVVESIDKCPSRTFVSSPSEPKRVLTDEQIERARKLGIEHITEIGALLEIKKQPDGLTYITPELNLAGAFADRDLTPEEIKNYANTDRVIFLYIVRGVSSDFPELIHAVIIFEDGSILRPVDESWTDTNYDSSADGYKHYWASMSFTFKYTSLIGKKFSLKITNKEPHHLDFTNEV